MNSRFSQKSVDIINTAYMEIAKYKFEVCIPPQNIIKADYVLNSLNWDFISYGNDDELVKIPNDKRGIYAFVIYWPATILPHHGYVLYIGIAGRKSDRSLRERYKDYLNEKTVRKREHIHSMLVRWEHVLKFFFAPIDNDISSEALEKLEKQLNSALIPPFSRGDFDGDLKSQMRAF